MYGKEQGIKICGDNLKTLKKFNNVAFRFSTHLARSNVYHAIQQYYFTLSINSFFSISNYYTLSQYVILLEARNSNMCGREQGNKIFERNQWEKRIKFKKIIMTLKNVTHYLTASIFNFLLFNCHCKIKSQIFQN